MGEHFAKILILCFEEKAKIIIGQRKKSKQKSDCKHLYFRNNWLLRSGQRFWEIAAATIEERLRLYGSKTRCFCPSESKATRIKASLSYIY
jgi:glycerol dehydrogenase-like iron-containing ADH family enzyme